MSELPRKSTTGYRKIGPYSRRLSRGVIGDNIDGRTLLGRFARDLEAQLIAHCGGNPTVTQRMLVDRAVKIRIQLDLLDEKMVSNSSSWTGHDQRTYGGLLNAYRLTVRELGLKPAASRKRSFVEQALADYEQSIA